MKSVRERFRKEHREGQFPYLDMGTDIANTYGLPVGRYVLVDAIGVFADEWNSDDIRLLWEIVAQAVDVGGHA